MICDKGHIVKNTSKSFFKGVCITCSGKVPWLNDTRYSEECEKINYKLLTTEKEWKEGTEKDGNDFKPKMICDKGHTVKNTSITNFVGSSTRCPECVKLRENLINIYKKIKKN